jgi:hypothetical protein
MMTPAHSGAECQSGFWLEIIGGWKKIPATYLATLGLDDAVRFHRQISPADNLSKEDTRTGPSKRGRL